MPPQQHGLVVLWRLAYCPVYSVARLIQHTDVVTQLWVNRTPSEARASRTGVCRIALRGFVLWNDDSV